MAESSQVKPSLVGLYVRNYIANFSGNFIIVLLNFFTPLAVYEDWQATLSEGHWVVIPFALISIFILVTLLQRLVQQPISDVLKTTHSNEKPQIELQMKARRRLLNLPYIMDEKDIRRSASYGGDFQSI